MKEQGYFKDPISVTFYFFLFYCNSVLVDPSSPLPPSLPCFLPSFFELQTALVLFHQNATTA